MISIDSNVSASSTPPKKRIDAIFQGDAVADVQKAVVHAACMENAVVLACPSGSGGDELLDPRAGTSAGKLVGQQGRGLLRL